MTPLYRFFCLLLFYTIACLPGFGQVASFTASPTTGCSPLVVNFTNTSTGATSYSWNLGNTVTTPDVDASTSYTSPGTYTITLTAYSGGSSSVYTSTITVFPSPTVTFTASDTAVCPGSTVTFNSTTTAGVPGPVTYLWNFGDGTSGTGSSPSHAFGAPGYYNITLSATNSEGCVSSLTIPDDIHVFPHPTPSFAVSEMYVCNPPGVITFTNTTAGTPPYTSTWTFGDGSAPGTGSPVTHTYLSTGSYNVTLLVTDGHGCTDSVTVPNAVIVASISASFTYPAVACMFSTINFNNTSTGSFSNYWNFGNGYTATTTSGSTAYGAAGTYTVMLVAINGGCTDTIRHTITILPNPAASFTFAPTASCPPPSAVNFTGVAPIGDTITWLFGDGSTGSGATASHTYLACGAFLVSMIITTDMGCRDTIQHTDDIYNLQVNINHDSTVSGCAPLTANFNCYVTYTCPSPGGAYPYGISYYHWNYGDGSPTVTGGSSISHTYTSVGEYTCSVYIETANGCSDTATLPVLVGTKPVASFTAVPTTVCYGKSVSFINTSTGATNYEWIFSDTLSDTLTSPTITFGGPGIYTVTLIASDNGCNDTLTRPDYITVDSPKAIIDIHFLCDPANEVLFIDTSWGDNTREWFFGDGSTSIAKDTVHFYPGLGVYTVTLTTYNIASGCRDTATAVVDLVHPTVTFTASDTAVCKYAAVTFTDSVLGSGASGFNWYDNGTYVGTGSPFTYHFTTTGWQSIELIMTDAHGCLDTFNKPNYILVAKPAVFFRETPDTGCVILNATFTDSSSDIAGTTFTNYSWTFGDGGSASGTSPGTAHSYTLAGSFTITEIVTDNLGCKDTATKTIYADQPHASFYAVPTTACAFSTITFYNTSSSTASSYWIFGDGSTATTTSPTHVYTAAGVYTVKLVVTDTRGCPDTATRLNYITISQPTAGFYMSDSFSICAPLSEVFTNTSTGAVSYYWTFGDGSSSTDFNTSDLYITPGSYTVTLIATNSSGCKDTIQETLIIYGYAGAFTYNIDSGCSPLTVNFYSSASNVSSLTWDFGDGTTSSLHSTPDTVHTYIYPGAYVPKLILSDFTGCENSSIGLDTIKVDGVNAKFTHTPACIGDTVYFQDISTSNWSHINSFLWTFNPGGTSVISNPTQVYLSMGTYSVSLQSTDAWGCIGIIDTTITITGNPTITASADTTICLSDAATLYGYGGVSYTWSPDVNVNCTACNPVSANPTVQTTYTVTGANANGCTSTDTVTVMIKTKTTSIGFGDTAVCDGTVVPVWDSGATKFAWTPPTGLSSTMDGSASASPNTTTTYTVIAQQASCIPDTNYITITIFPLPTVTAGQNQSILAGTSTQLQATGTNIYTYDWTPAASLNCASCSNPIASMTSSTVYTITVATYHGCLASDTVLIDLYCSNTQIFIPNTFTPNGDGQDDVFYPRGTGIETIKSFRIYNRWGELLFERTNFQANDPAYAWDGSFSGAPPKPDVYVYILEATCDTGLPLFMKGDVTIIK